MVLTGQFIKMLSEDSSWTIGEDFGEDKDILLRKNCARILHRYLQKVVKDPDATEDLPSVSDIPDINDCRICAPHIAQMIAKKIMRPNSKGSIKLFEGDKEVSENEAKGYICLIRESHNKCPIS